MPDLPENLADISDYFSGVNEYLQDHVGLRNFFISSYQRELEDKFDKTSNNSKVLKGLDGWYFFDNFGLIEDFFGYTPLSKDELDAWIEQIQARRDWLEGRGIRYLHVIAPNKQSMYPQYVMENGLQLKGETRFEQLQNHLPPSLSENMVNLHSALGARLSEGQLYFKNDSHWNKRGAYFAYLEIIKRFSRWFPDEKFKTDFIFKKDRLRKGGNLGFGGDLARMSGVMDAKEVIPLLKGFRKCAERFPLENYNLTGYVWSPVRPSLGFRCNEKKLRAVVFRDSFFVQPEQFFSENFKEVVYLWKGYDQENVEEIIKRWKPDIVMEMIVERDAFNILWPEASE